MNILIINFGGIGDIINSTPIALHYKRLDKTNQVHFLTKEKYREILLPNKNIDEIIKTNDTLEELDHVSHSIEVKRHLIKYVDLDYYDKICFSAPYMSPLYDRTSRSRLIKIIKHECSGINNWLCDFIPNISLSHKEIHEADSFYKKLNGDLKVMVEFDYLSNQSNFSYSHLEKICTAFEGFSVNIILTSKKTPVFINQLKKSFDLEVTHYSGSFLSNARLYNLIDIFIGCSSGITCLTSSDYCDAEKPRIEVVRGPHWSTEDWTHNSINKKICYNFESFDNALTEFLNENIIPTKP